MFETISILTIDDSSTIRNYLRGLLAPMCKGLVGASTGQEGLDKSREWSFELILLDLLLPDMDGIEVLNRIRERDEECAVVMLTGEGGISTATAALQHGADGYIEKQDVVSGDHAAFFYALEQALERRASLVAQRKLQAEIAEKVEQLAISEKKALEASRAKSTFLASMSHELRTPLNAILGFIQLMERDPTLNGEQREHLAIIARSGEHLLALINDILSLSKIEAGLLTLNENTFDLHRLLQSLEEMFRQRAQSKGLQLIFDIGPSIPQYAWGDDGKLRQVLINLLGNAVKFTDAGGVRLRADYQDEICDLEVEDTGYGIAEEELGGLFEAFVQTQSGQRSKEGTGLGLAISRSFVRLMGGEIHVKSRIGKGTTFGFEIRLPPSAGSDIVREERKVIGVAPGQEDFRILVVDDKWENRALLVKLLSSIGLEVREAGDGRQALDVWNEWEPQLIWMDMRMPIMDGYAATREIRQTEAVGDGVGEGVGVRRVPIVALTASAFEADREAALSAGCDDFIAKPFREQAVFDKLTQHLGLQFVYDEPRQATAITSEGMVTPARLRNLSSDLLTRLNEAVIQGDIEAAYGAVDAISAADEPLANELRTMVRDFKFDEIQDLVEGVVG